MTLWCDNTVAPREFTGQRLRTLTRDFFDHRKADVEGADLLFYFSGHAVKDDTMTVLLGPDGDSLSFVDLMSRAEGALARAARSVTIILDCCLSGDLADRSNPDPFIPSQQAIVPTNCSLLTATSPNQEAKENERHGYFTEYLLGGLRGAAADIIGDVTSLSLYSHVSAALAHASQQPVFKSYSVLTPVLSRAVPQVPRQRLV